MGAALGVSAALLTTLAGGATAIGLVWTMVVSPLTATANQATTFTFTVTNLLELDGIGCVEVQLPDGFELNAFGPPSASNGQSWQSSLSDDGAGGLFVVNYASADPGVLRPLETVSFTVRATPTADGVAAWPNHVHRDIDCSDANDEGPPLEVVVLPGPTPTPIATATPTPSPSATHSPSATPRATATPRALTATPPPPTPAPTPSPSASAGDQAVTPTRRPTASRSAEPDAVPLSPNAGVGPAAGAGERLLRIPDSPGIDAGLGILALLDAPATWIVPAAAVGVPGLLVVLWVAAQTVGAAVLMPAVRRWGDDRPRPARTRPRRG